MNSGPRGVNQRMQDSLNAKIQNLNLIPDGIIGTKTINAINDLRFEDFATFYNQIGQNIMKRGWRMTKAKRNLSKVG